MKKIINIPLLKDKSIPYWQLSSVYFSNCLVLGLVLPFWGLYLQSIGQSESQIGISSALILASNFLAPFFWTKFTSSSNSTKIIRLGVSCAFITSLALFLFSGFLGTSLLIFLICFCWQGINPLVESLTLSHLASKSLYYGQIRLWGSIGFVVSVSVLGLFFDYFSISNFPFIFSFLLFVMVVFVAITPQKKVLEQKSKKLDIVSKIKSSKTLLLFIGVFLLQLSDGAYVGFYSLYLSSKGYSISVIGNLWAVAVIAEVIMFMVTFKLIRQFGADKLLFVAFILTSIRWSLIAYFPGNLIILIFAQVLHAFTFSAAHSSILELIKIHFGEEDQNKGILVYSSFCLAGATAIGSIFSGVIWEANMNIFAISSVIALLAACVIYYWSRKIANLNQ